MSQRKLGKVTALTLVLLTIVGYGYYNYASYQVYKTMKSFDPHDNPLAIELCTTVLESKYRYSIYSLMIDG